MEPDREVVRPRHRAALVFMGLFAGLTTGLLVLLTRGEALALVAFGLIVGGAIAAAVGGTPMSDRIVLAALTFALIGSIAVIGYGTAQILAALAADSAGPVAPPNAAALAAAEEKLDQSAGQTGFFIELTERELNAVLQDALAQTDNPFRRVTIDITNAVGDPGRIDFTGEFKNGDLDVTGTLGAEVEGGSVELQILDVDVGMFSLPGVARQAVEDMIADLADLGAAVAAEGADIQQIVVGGDAVAVTGVNRSEDPVDAARVLAAFAAGAELEFPTVEVEGRVPPGRVNGTSAEGDRYYVALGDSLAANVGVDDATLGYVSRLHRVLEGRDATTYGLRNFAVSGETSGTLVSAGQLDAAEQFAATRDVAYVTIDIGANDLLGHLGSGICREDIEADACTDRLESSLAAYSRNIEEIFDRLADAFPDARIIVMTAYNPFSFGFGEAVTFESASDEALARLNDIAALAAIERGFLVADGFTPMRGTVTVTTHMVDVPPDIHPTGLGFDVLTGALIEALSPQ